ISYFPDGKQMVSASGDKTVRLWDLEAGKEIEEARVVREQEVRAVAVSRDGRWVITAGGNPFRVGPGELKACEVDTGIVKTFDGHSRQITCIDISLDSKQLASGSSDGTARIWSLDTGEPVAGPFEHVGWIGAVRFSQDSKKLAEPKMIYEFDSSTLETVGTPFVGHTHFVTGLALSIGCTLLASASFDDTIKLWAFESRQ
ncbi:WD40 repeat-like protein, partial [Rhizopogon salebrosus TDB-379]